MEKSDKFQKYYKAKYIKNKIKRYYKTKKENDSEEKNNIRAQRIRYYYKNESQTKKQINYFKQLSKKDPIYRVVISLSTRATAVLKKYETTRILTHMEIIGCTYEVLKRHLEERFKDGMSYFNYGKWEVDHIIPVSSFDLTDWKEILKCFNYTNLQPLWMTDNRSKGSKIL